MHIRNLFASISIFLVHLNPLLVIHLHVSLGYFTERSTMNQLLPEQFNVHTLSPNEACVNNTQLSSLLYVLRDVSTLFI